MSTKLIPVEAVEEDKFVNLLVVYNALNMMDRQEAKLSYHRGKTLEQFLEGLPQPELWSICVNAEPYGPDEWHSVYPQPNDYITVIPIPYGGGDSKGVLRIVAMVAIAIVAPYAGGAMATAMGGAATGTLASGLTAAFTVVGGMLVNSILPPPTASSNNKTDLAESATYGIDGAKNTQTEDTIVPLIYGEYRYFGNYVNVKSENWGDTQMIYAQSVVSEGPIESITDFQIEEQPASNFDDVSTVVRLGDSPQSTTGWFASTVEMQNKGITLTTDWTEHTTVGEIDGFRMDYLLPQGLSNIDDEDGDREHRSVTIEIQYRKEGESTWKSVFPSQYREFTGSRLPDNSTALRVEYSQNFRGTTPRKITGKLYVRASGGSWQLKETISRTLPMSSGYGHLGGVAYVALSDTTTWDYKFEWSGASPTITASARYQLSPTIRERTSQPLRRSFESGVLPEGRYVIRTRRTNNEAQSDYAYDKVVLSDVAEIISERVRYNYTAFFGVRVKLTDQLTNLPKMSAKIKGIKVPHYDVSGRLVKRAWSANPAWITADLLTNTRYGAGLPASRLDMPKFVEWAAFCDEKKYYFNGVLDTFSNVWDACQKVLRVGHARFTSIGNILSLAIYKPSQPVMMFGTGNILEGSLSLSWQSIEDRSNEFEIEFYDRENANKQSTVRVADEEALARGEVQRISTTRMIGIDNQKQALHEAHFQKALNQALVMSGKFDASIESIACGVGDVVLLQHDMPEWGESGRLRPGSGRSEVIVDRPLTIASEPDAHSLMVIHPAIKRAEGTVGSVNGSTIFISAGGTSYKFKRVKVAGKDIRVIDASPSGAYIETVLETTAGISGGDTIELWDVNVIETRRISAYDSDANTVTLAGPLSVDPMDFANYMIGITDAEAKPVTITGINGSGDYKRTISFVEYNETIFTPENVEETPIYTKPVTGVQHVRDLLVREELTIRGGGVETDILVAWTPPADGNYAGAHIYLSRNNSSMVKVGSAYAGATSYSTTGRIGDELIFKVVAYDGAGRSANYDTAPTWMHLVEGASAPPKQVTNFKVEKGLGGIEFTWDRSTEVDVTGFEIREGVSWGAGVSIVEDYSGNRFFTTKKQGGLYTYHIKATDALGNQSEEAATAVLMLPAPSIVVGFASVQNGDQLVLQWRKNPEIDVVGYEVRQGASWANSKHVAYVSGTSLTIPAGASATESYLIKAYDSAGVESTVAARVDQAVFRSQTYNAIFSLDATDLNYPGHYINLIQVGGRLEGAGSGEFFEYLQPIEMPKRFNATLTTQEIVAIKSTASRTWKDMNFPWFSSQSKTPWFPTEESDDLVLDKQLTLYTGPSAIDKGAWTLEDASSAPAYGTGSLTASSVSTGVGRFGYGQRVTSGSSVLEASVQGEIASWWVKYESGDELGQLVGESGSATIRVTDGALRLESGQTALQPTELTLKAGHHYFVVGAVVGGRVKAFVACLETEVTVEVVLEQDIGALSAVKLA